MTSLISASSPPPSRRTFAAALLASSVLASSVVVWPLAGAAQTPSGSLDAAGAPAPPATNQVAEVIITAEKRAQNIQNVPISVQALDMRTLEQHQVNNFQDFVKLTPSVNFQTVGPSQTTLYMRGISSGGIANALGTPPTVGSYLDEAPITTVAGTLDVHIYDIARIEVLPGPQGTLYGASSESGTVRIITNAPSTSGFSAGYNLEGDTVDHGDQGYVAEGFVNVPIDSKAAIRLVAFDEHDAGFIDNVPGTRLFPTSGGVVNNSALVKNNFNPVDTFGFRTALKVDLNENWTITPTLLAQDQRAEGEFGYEPDVGFLDVQRYQPDARHDRWGLAALTVNGKIGDFDLTYTGSLFHRFVDQQSDYSDYSFFYDTLYGLGAYWPDNNGNPLKNPAEEIVDKERYGKRSDELRLASPVNERIHFIAGLFEERQTHFYDTDFDIKGFEQSLAVPGTAESIYTNNQERIDRDVAAFTEVTFEVTPHIQIVGGVRGYYYKNTLDGFFGFAPAYYAFAGYGGERQCIRDTTYHHVPCINLDNGVAASGETHKINLTYKFDSKKLVYFTYSTGYRPGGVNQVADYGEYQSDTLTNYELGWKTSWLDRRLIWDGAAYFEDWNHFQFAFPGPNAITEIENAPEGQVEGLETNAAFAVTPHFNLDGGFVFNHARLVQNFCGLDTTTGDLVQSCSNADAVAVKGTPLPYTPSYKGDVTGRYAMDLFGWASHAQATVAYRSTTPVGLRTIEVQGLGSLPSLTTLDLALGAERDRFTIELFLKNALDAHGEIDRHSSCASAVCYSAIPGAPSVVYHFPIQPLTLGLRIGQRF